MSATPQTDREVYTIGKNDIGFNAVNPALCRLFEQQRDQLAKALAEACDTVEAWAPEHRAAAVNRQLAPFRAILAKHTPQSQPITEGAS